MSKPQAPNESNLHLEILPQPNDTTCGPTCLHAIYRYYGDKVKLPDVLDSVEMLAEGGTLAVFLATDALKRGYDARIYTNNLGVFDPTWFNSGLANAEKLREKLRGQMAQKNHTRLQIASLGYLNFLAEGGEIRFTDLTPALLRKYLGRGHPIITGLSSTFLYQSAREVPDTNQPDDIAGEPGGHFVVLCGYDSKGAILVADPYYANPVAEGQMYQVSEHRLISSVLLGVLTHDANLIVITPSSKKTRQGTGTTGVKKGTRTWKP